MLRFTNTTLMAACAAGLFCADLLAGGFFLTLGNPVASHDPKAQGAVLLVRPDGCHNPVGAKVEGTAEGIVGGVRRSVTLDLTPLAAPGTYAVMHQWPAEGTWVLRLTARSDGRTTSALVPVDADGFHRESAKWFPGEAPAGELDAMLHGTASRQVAASR